MKRLTAMLMLTILLSPALAWAGSATDAALGLGAFAVFNQILSGVGIFGGAPPVVVERPVPPVVYSPPPVVYTPPPPPVVYSPPPAVVYAPPPVVYGPPPAVVYRPAPRPVYRAPGVVYEPAPRFVYRERPAVRRAEWCPPGLAKQGRSDREWRH